ncbi:integrase arm-type DNA-binding domain-containing protein [Pseudomonas aeruginosa]|uniref:tyrosine-type recombinase/integrase n=1 Tax=Pseudomonas aeruginosa TaxID=287 RepID=UPI00094093DE|nr:integrase arm-type DNA-binding domain-containing protein [Pseudomonas aeruginosa]MBW6313688.1 integrase arm-type DNA-binding domain-containing protein [Pseudomonas aeruginosa]MDV8047395.1 integrase arm-type DNA-binding domain-containing protein [Pseudomonas aeruginosa]HCL4030619.1 integrase arm-type DNA-binding domain-containing protein [Pseudomonas aeruginosa]
MALTEMAIRHARVTAKEYTLADSDGLFLNVTAQGSKIWHFRYYWEGRQKRMSFGSYPQVGLRDARERRDEARALIAQGFNPCEQRKQQRVALRLANDQTFDAVFEQWIAFRRLSLKEGRQSTLSQILRIFAKDIQPYIGEQSIHEINRHVLMDLLSRIECRKAFTTAEKCRTWLNQLFRYALVRIAGLEHNPAADLDVVAVPKPPVEHNPFLRMEELPHFLGKLRAFRGSQQTQLGIRLLLLTGVRTGELRLATPDQFDLERRLWIIPPEVVKQLQLKMRNTRRQTAKVPPYIVPLSIQAAEVVRLLLDQVVPAQRHLLTHRSDLSKRISENTLNSALRRMGFADRLTGHGVRATISTALNEIGYPKIWIDAQLSHADPNKVSSAYNHAEYVEQRRTMMQDWANRLDLWVQGHTKAAASPLTIRLEGVSQLSFGLQSLLLPPVRSGMKPEMSSLDVEGSKALADRFGASEVSAVRLVSDIQRERAEMLEIYEAATNLPLLSFARLAGKSRDQINRDIKARRLLSLSLGNRGQRIPDWQLDPVKHKLVLAIFKSLPQLEAWEVYRLLSEPHDRLRGRIPLDVVQTENFETTLASLIRVRQIA